VTIITQTTPIQPPGISPRLWISDFDGTVKPLNGPVSREDILAVQELGRLGAVRAVATGRSIKTFLRDWDPLFEIDYLISSSGLAISRFGPEGHAALLSSHQFTPSQAEAAVAVARSAGMGFFLALPPPETHLTFWQKPPSGTVPSCFEARILHSGGDTSPWDGDGGRTLAQVLVMGAPPQVRVAESRFRSETPDLSLVVSSSPYGDGALWLEIYPAGVSKGIAAATLAASLGIPAQDAVALGNDYNDEDLLAWAGTAFVSSDAPETLKILYPGMPPAGQGPLANVAGRLVPDFGSR
jgi:hydroxymethylpyrimidine pyrophosphatase-like HAD family hydrolase